MINGHGSKAYLVEDLENEFGYDSINLENINTNELILAVKIRDAFLLDKDESKSILLMKVNVIEITLNRVH